MLWLGNRDTDRMYVLGIVKGDGGMGMVPSAQHLTDGQVGDLREDEECPVPEERQHLFLRAFVVPSFLPWLCC